MRKPELTEATAILQRGLTNLLGSVPSLTGATASDLRRAVGALSAKAAAALDAGAVGGDLATCFDLARIAGATFDTIDRVRVAGEAETPTMLAGQAVATAIVRLCIVAEAQIVSATTFTSRNDVDAILDRILPVFDSAILFASDEVDADAYQSLAALQAALVSDLAARARPLPRMISYEFGQSMPALWVAQRLYGDAARAVELIAENKVVHPLFMPRRGRALSA